MLYIRRKTRHSLRTPYDWRQYYRSCLGVKTAAYLSGRRPRMKSAKTQLRGGFTHGGPARPRRPLIRHRSNVIFEEDLYDYMPLFSSIGEQWAYYYDGNFFSADGAFWCAYYQFYKVWNTKVLNGLDGFPEGVLYYNMGGMYLRGRVGPNRRYILYPRPPIPPRPPPPPDTPPSIQL